MQAASHGHNGGVRVAVVGAGFAGLMAADDLRRRGHDPVVLEARNRVGGRVWSQRLVADDEATVVERGAEFVLDGYHVMRSVLSDLGLSLADTGMTYYVRTPVSDPATTHAAMASVADAFARAEKQAGASVADVVARLSAGDFDQAAKDAFVSRISVTSGVDAGRLSAAAADDLTRAFEPKPSWRVVGGNQLLADGLARRLGGTVRLRTAVRAVQQDDQCVRVVTDDGVVSADAAILAVPLTVLREMDLPGAPDAVRAAWQRQAVGHNAKLHLRLLEPAPTSAVQSVAGRFWTWTATDGSGGVQPVLHCFGGTTAGLAELGVGSGPAQWVKRVVGLRPDLHIDESSAVLTSWDDDPWARMSYSAATVEAQAGDEELVGQPFGLVHVAGEHTAGAHTGLMEGALRSGRRAAAQVLAHANA